jgi:hypothetical protein
MILKKFVVDDFGLFFNIRMDKETKKRLSYSENQRQRAVKKKLPESCRGIAGA